MRWLLDLLWSKAARGGYKCTMDHSFRRSITARWPAHHWHVFRSGVPKVCAGIGSSPLQY